MLDTWTVDKIMDNRMRILDLISMLVTPVSNLATAVGDYLSLNNILQHNISKVANEIETEGIDDSLLYDLRATLAIAKGEPRWSFVASTLKLLAHLSQTLDEIATAASETDGGASVKPNQAPQPPASALNPCEQKVVATALQFVVRLAIYPNLDANVGGLTLDPKQPRNTWQLHACVRSLTKSQWWPGPAVGAGSGHLCDVLAALLQLCFGPATCQLRSAYDRRARSCADATASIPQPKWLAPDASSVEALTEEEYEECRRDLVALLNCAHQPLVVRSLLILQGGDVHKVKKRPVPTWLWQECGRLLSELLLKPCGVSAVIIALANDDEAPSLDWMKCRSITCLIANPPQQVKSVNDYYMVICAQLLDLLALDVTTRSRVLVRVACACVATMWRRQPVLTRTYVLDVVMTPLLICTAHYDSSAAELLADESSLSSCIRALHRLFASTGEPDGRFLVALAPVLHPLLALFCFTRQGVSHLKQPVQDILVTFFKQADTDFALSCLMELVFEKRTERNDRPALPRTNSRAVIQTGSEGGARVTRVSSSRSMDEILAEIDVETRGVVALLQMLPADALPAEFFISVMQMLTDAAGVTETEKVSSWDCALREAEMMAAMCESLGPAMMTKKRHVVEFSETLLRRYANKCFPATAATTAAAATATAAAAAAASSDDAESNSDAEAVMMVVSILTLVMEDTATTSADWQSLKAILPHLHVIGASHPELFVKEMVQELEVAIATHCAVPISKKTASERKRTRPAHVANLSTGKLIEVVQENVSANDRGEFSDRTGEITRNHSEERSVENTASRPRDASMPTLDASDAIASLPASTAPPPGSPPACTTDERASTAPPPGSPPAWTTDERASIPSDDAQSTPPLTSADFMDAWKDALSALAPVRAGGMRAMARLVRSGEAGAHADRLLALFVDNMADDDSYVYLSAVQGVEAMADAYPRTVVPALTQMFLNASKVDEQPKVMGEPKVVEEPKVMGEPKIMGGPKVVGEPKVMEEPKVMGEHKLAGLPEVVVQSKYSVETRLKLGEALMRASRNLGETLPGFMELLLHACLRGARDEEPLIRASSLSNLAEVCRLSRFSLGPVLHELLSCLTAVLGSDPQPEVRRAAVHVIRLLLQGVGSDVLTVLGATIRALYRLLKKVYEEDVDDVVRLHSQLALEELDVVMRELIFPKQKLEKKIRILEPF